MQKTHGWYRARENNLVYYFLLGRTAFLSYLLLKAWIKHLLWLSSSPSIRGFSFFSLRHFFWTLCSADIFLWSVDREKKPSDNESRDLSSPPQVLCGQGQVIRYYWDPVSHQHREQLNSKVPSGSDILFPNITLFHSQATKNLGAHKWSTKLISSKVWKIYQPIILWPASFNLFILCYFWPTCSIHLCSGRLH